MNNGTECTNINEHDEDCHRPVEPGAPVSLCRVHMVLAAQFVVDLQRAHKDAAPETSRATLKFGRPQAVYYLKLGNRIKIGTTTNLPQRLLAVPHDEVLAVEPGGNATERNRHAQFARHRTTGEWFKAHAELNDHIAAIRSIHGEPIEAWKRLASRHADK